MKSNLTKMIGGLALLAVAGSSQAGFLFDPDGNLGPAGTVNIDTFDVAPTSVLGKGANQAIANFLNGSGSTQFDIYTQGKITGLLDSGNNNLLPNSLGGELTVVMGFREEVIDAFATSSIGFAQFNTVSTGPSFVEIYFDTSPDSNRLAGTGYGADAGSTLIFSSTILGSLNDANTYSSSLSASNITNLDSNSNDGNGDLNNNDWNNATLANSSQLTVSGNGANSAIQIENDIPPAYVNPNFFKNLKNIVEAFFVDINLNTPFAGATSNDPMRQFITTAGAANADYTVWNGVGGAGTTLGAINGGLTNVNGTWIASGPDFLFSTDANINLQATIPEPGTIAMIGIGLIGFGFSAHRKSNLNLFA